jgi:hypothetical protein
VAKRPREKQVAVREQHPVWELLNTAAERPRESGLESGSGETPRDGSWHLLAAMAEELTLPGSDRIPWEEFHKALG